MDKAINYLGIAMKAGMLTTGEVNSGSAVRSGKARLLLLAQDASDNAVSRAMGFIFGRDVPIIKTPYTKQTLSEHTGKAGCSMAVFTDIGLADSFMSAICSAYPGEYDEPAAEIRRRKERARQRKREEKAHELSRKTGKRRKKL